MAWKYIFRKKPIKGFAKLNKQTQERIIKKLDYFALMISYVCIDDFDLIVNCIDNYSLVCYN